MPISPPITGRDLETLPDDTEFVEDLAANEDVETVVPFFLGDGDVGRFVTAFVAVSGTTMTLYARRRDGDAVDFEQIDATTVGEPAAWVGTLWNQTVSFDGDDLAEVVELRERAGYETHWLFAGTDPEQPFETYRRDPLGHEPTGFETCDHQPGEDQRTVPNVGIQVSSCGECGTPLFVTGDTTGTRTMEVLNAVHIGEAFGDDGIRGFRITGNDAVSSREEALHVLSRLANNENPSLQHYARGDRQALLFLVGDQIVGYVAWDDVGPDVLLRAIYVLPEYRGEGGLAETMVAAFYDELDHDEYLVETPNDAARDALARAGHLDTGIVTPVATLACRDTTDASDPGAIYADPRPHPFNPVE